MFCSEEDYIAVQDISSQLSSKSQNMHGENFLNEATAIVVESGQSYSEIMEELETNLICGSNGITPDAVQFIMDYYNNSRWDDIKECNIDRCQVPSMQELFDEVLMYNDEVISQITDQAELPYRCSQCDQRYWCYIDGDYTRPYEDDEKQDKREECYGYAVSDMYEYYTYNGYLYGTNDTALSIVSALNYAIWSKGYCEEYDLFEQDISCYMKDKMIILNDAQMTMFAEFADNTPFEPSLKLSEVGFMMIGCD